MTTLCLMMILNSWETTKEGFDFGSNQFIDEQKDAQLRKGKLKRDDVVLTTRGTLGNVAHYDARVPLSTAHGFRFRQFSSEFAKACGGSWIVHVFILRLYKPKDKAKKSATCRNPILATYAPP